MSSDRNTAPQSSEAQAALRDFYAARGEAIQAFASLEMALCLLIVAVGRVGLDMASEIFFESQIMRERLNAIEKLLQCRSGDAYAKPWKSLRTKIKGLNETRNKVVHWHQYHETSKIGKQIQVLLPASLSKHVNSKSALAEYDIKQFTKSTAFVSEVVRQWSAMLLAGEHTTDAEVANAVSTMLSRRKS